MTTHSNDINLHAPMSRNRGLATLAVFTCGMHKAGADNRPNILLLMVRRGVWIVDTRCVVLTHWIVCIYSQTNGGRTGMGCTTITGKTYHWHCPIWTSCKPLERGDKMVSSVHCWFWLLLRFATSATFVLKIICVHTYTGTTALHKPTSRRLCVPRVVVPWRHCVSMIFRGWRTIP